MDLLTDILVIFVLGSLSGIFYELHEMHKDINGWMLKLHRSSEATNTEIADLTEILAAEIKATKR